MLSLVKPLPDGRGSDQDTPLQSGIISHVGVLIVVCHLKQLELAEDHKRARAVEGRGLFRTRKHQGLHPDAARARGALEGLENDRVPAVEIARGGHERIHADVATASELGDVTGNEQLGLEGTEVFTETDAYDRRLITGKHDPEVVRKREGRRLQPGVFEYVGRQRIAEIVKDDVAVIVSDRHGFFDGHLELDHFVGRGIDHSDEHEWRDGTRGAWKLPADREVDERGVQEPGIGSTALSGRKKEDSTNDADSSICLHSRISIHRAKVHASG